MTILALVLAATFYEQAMELHKAGKYAEAVRAYEQAWDKGERVPGMMYNRACAEARAGMGDKAFEHLAVAVQNGQAQPEMLAKDDDLDTLHADARWPKLLASAEVNAHPCKSKPHDFDFWVGEWLVQDPAGHKLGTSRVEQILDGCVILESWRSGFGKEGKSFNVYEPETKRWRQTWVDDQGRQTDYAGAFEGKSLVYKAKIGGKDTTMTFTPLAGGKVRQYITQEGSPPWEGIYVKGPAK